MKTLRTAALVVGAVALVATGVGAAASAGLIGVGLGSSAAVLGTTAGVLTAVGAIGGAIAGVATMLLAKQPSTSISGNQTKFTASMDQGIPYAIGRTAVAGWMIHRQTFDHAGSKNNAFQSLFGVWSAGKIKGIEAFQVDGKTVSFATDPKDPSVPDQAVGGFHDYMWLRTQLGAEVEAAALQATGFYPYPAGWSAQSKLSGYAAFAWTLKFDDKGKVYPGGAVPAPRAILLGNYVYDPRQDSTYPGGSGDCRALDESTYVWSENGALHALTWALGRWQLGKRILGIGFALASIDVGSYVQAANVADANGWKAGGCVYSTDGKWDVLKKMLGTCSGEPLQLGGMLSCTVDTPRVSLAVVTDDDIIGRCSIPGTSRIRDRINGVIPSYRSEAHDWQIVPAAKVQIADYIAADRRPRTKAVTWELVQDANQVAELAAYYICNSREFGPATLPLKLRWIGYKPGDAITIRSNTVGMQDQLVVIRKRHLDPSTGAVTMTVRSETTAKHAFALGQTTTPPPTPALQAVDRTQLLIPGVSASWSATIDDDGKRPQDGATVGAPNGTYVGSTLAEEIEAKLAQLEQSTGTDTVPPAVPANVAIASVLAGDGTVDLTISWDAVADTDLSSYEVAIALNGGGSVSYVTPGTSYVLHGILPNTAVRARVRAVDRSGNRSAFSDEVAATTVRDTTPPGPPTNIAITPGIGALYIEWANPADTDLAGIRIRIGDTDDVTKAAASGTTATAIPNVGGRWTITGLSSVNTRYYWISAFDTSGNESSLVGPFAAAPIKISGKTEITEQSITAPLLYAQDAAIADLVVSTMRVGTLSANVLKGGSSLPGSLRIGQDGFELSTIAAGAATGAVGANRVPFSGFEAGITGGPWIAPAYNPAGIATGASSFRFNGKSIGKLTFRAANPYSVDSNQQASIEFRNEKPDYWVTVTPGERIWAGALIETSNCVATSYIVWGTGALEGTTAVQIGPDFDHGVFPGNADADWSAWLSGAFFTVPAGFTKAALRHYAHAKGAGDGFLSIAEPRIVGVSAAQTAPPPYNPGPINIDPAQAVNAGTTLITPGRISVGGTNPLSSWIYGGDTALINGGAVAANTIAANKLTIGVRGVQILDIAFDTNRQSTLSWSGGYVEWMDDANNRRVDYMRGESAAYDPNNPVAVVWVWFDRSVSPNYYGDGSGHLFSGMPAGGAAEILRNTNNVIVASYRNGTNMVVYNGRTIIDGDVIKTGTVQADRLIANSISGYYLQADSISARELGADAVTARSIKVGVITASKFVTDQGVDLASVVRGEFNWRGGGGGGVSGTLTRGNQRYGPYGVTASYKMDGHRLAGTIGVTYRSSGNATAPNGDPIYTYVEIYLTYNNGSGWQNTNYQLAVDQIRGGAGQVSRSFPFQFFPGGEVNGQTQWAFQIRVSDNGDTSTSADLVILGTWSFYIEGTFWK